MKESNIKGYFTNHSLKASATTRMYDTQLDEATIMSRTGHRSVDGIRTYKRTTAVLQELSSAILNGTTSRNTKEESTVMEVKDTEEALIDAKEEKTTAEVKDKNSTREAKEETRRYTNYPQMDFGNASNFTINFNTK